MAHFNTLEQDIDMLKAELMRIENVSPYANYKGGVIDDVYEMGEEMQLVSTYRDMFLNLKEIPLSLATYYDVEPLQGDVQRAATSLELIESMVNEGLENNIQKYNDTIYVIKEHFKNRTFRDRYLAALVQKYIGSGARQSVTNMNDAIVQAKNLMSESEAELKEIYKWRSDQHEKTNNFVKRIERAEEAYQDLSGKARELLGNVNIRKQSKIFEDAANGRKTEAIVWVCLAVVALSVLVYFACILPTDLSLYTPKAYAEIASRMSVLTMLTFALLFCARNYSACRHNATVNGHRRDALETFEYFRDALPPEEIETRRAMLVEAARVIYSHSNSGYLKASADSPSPSQFVEVVSKVVEKG